MLTSQQIKGLPKGFTPVPKSKKNQLKYAERVARRLRAARPFEPPKIDPMVAVMNKPAVHVDPPRPIISNDDGSSWFMRIWLKFTQKIESWFSYLSPWLTRR
jgi:hypothetical protein